MTDYPLVTVIWNDAHGSEVATEITLEEARAMHRPHRYRLTGYQLVSDEAGITLVMEIDEMDKGTFRTRQFVPRGCIVRQWTVREVEEEAASDPSGENIQ